jgi:ABC-type sugar transport system substrate-binding protein
VKIWPIAIAAVSAVLLIGCAPETQLAPVHEDPARSGSASAHEGIPRAGSAPVRIGVVLNALDNPFWLAIYEGAGAAAAQRGVLAIFRAVTSNADLAGQAAQLRALVAAPT